MCPSRSRCFPMSHLPVTVCPSRHCTWYRLWIKVQTVRALWERGRHSVAHRSRLVVHATGTHTAIVWWNMNAADGQSDAAEISWDTEERVAALCTVGHGSYRVIGSNPTGDEFIMTALTERAHSRPDRRLDRTRLLRHHTFTFSARNSSSLLGFHSDAHFSSLYLSPHHLLFQLSKWFNPF